MEEKIASMPVSGALFAFILEKVHTLQRLSYSIYYLFIAFFLSFSHAHHLWQRQVTILKSEPIGAPVRC